MPRHAPPHHAPPLSAPPHHAAPPHYVPLPSPHPANHPHPPTPTTPPDGSRNSGTLQQLHETQAVTLYCSTQRLDLYSTYVVVENVDNPDDLKTLHVKMVVADSSASNYFSVIVDTKGGGRSASLVPDSSYAKKEEALHVEMGDVYYDMLYTNRSFVVQNQSSMPLDFLILHDLQHASSTELNFSLSNTSLKVFSTLRVPANSSTRVFLHLRTCPPRDGGVAARTAASQLDSPNLQIEISVSCRLVKDHRKLIHLRANCRPPQLGLSHTELAFSTPPIEPSAIRSNTLARLRPAQQEIQVRNIGGDFGYNAPLSYAVRSSCCFFIVRAEEEDTTLGPSADPTTDAAAPGSAPEHLSPPSHTIEVLPNLKAIQAHLSFLSKVRRVRTTDHVPRTAYHSDHLTRTTHHLPLTTHHSPLTTHHSPLTTHCT